MIDSNRVKGDSTTLSPPLSPSPCFLLGSPAPPFVPPISMQPPALYLSSSSPHSNGSCPIVDNHQQPNDIIVIGNNSNNNVVDNIVNNNSNNNGENIDSNISSNSNNNNNNSANDIGGPLLTFSSSSVLQQTTQETPSAQSLSESNANIPLSSSLSFVPLPPNNNNNNNNNISINSNNSNSNINVNNENLLTIANNDQSNSIDNGNIINNINNNDSNNNNNEHSMDIETQSPGPSVPPNFDPRSSVNSLFIINLRLSSSSSGTLQQPVQTQNDNNNNNINHSNSNNNNIDNIDSQTEIKPFGNLFENNNSTTTTSTTTTSTITNPLSNNTNTTNNSNTTTTSTTTSPQNIKKRNKDEAELDFEFLNTTTSRHLQYQSNLNASLPNQLINREMYRARPGTNSLQSRKFYLNIVPNKTVENVEIPYCIIKKFTSDGEKLLCFSRDFKEIQLYRFLGSSPSYPLKSTSTERKTIDQNFSNYFSLIYTSTIPPLNEYLCKDFSLTTTCGKYFILASYGQSTTSNNQQQQQQPQQTPTTTTTTTTTTTNTTIPTQQQPNPHYLNRQHPQNVNEIHQSLSNSINLQNPEDISFYLVRIQDGVVCDKRTFKRDVIHLPHHSGVYLYQDFFIVLSLQYQAIHIFQIKGSKFVNIRTIGSHCNEDDEMEIQLLETMEKPFIIKQQQEKLLQQQKEQKLKDISNTSHFPLQYIPQLNKQNNNNNQNNNNQNQNQINNNTNNNNNNTNPITTNPNTTNTTNTTTSTTTTTSNITQLPNGAIGGIKQRFLSYLFKKAFTSPDSKKALSMYYSLFPQYCNLVMWKMQSLDASHLLIKYGSIDGLLGRYSDYCSQICFFVVYNMHTTEVIGVYENSNKEFAKTFEQFCEHFRACSCPSGLIKFRSTCSNNIYVREHLMKQKMAVVNARYGGETQAVKRILSALPFSPQSWNESPYFDKYLFSYDEKIISSTERPKPLVDYPIKFYSRLTGEIKFKLNTGGQEKTDRQSKKYATYIFHPYFPFIISLQHSTTSNNTIANFHYKTDDLEKSLTTNDIEEDISINEDEQQQN